MSNVICAGNAIKEILSPSECLKALMDGAERAGVDLKGHFLISDGGDGFLEACAGLGNFERHEVACTGPLGGDISAPFLYDLSSFTAYIEMALCSGLNLIEPERRNVLVSGTAGLGDLVFAARNLGAKHIYVGLGGSATCDGGIGFLWRLGDLTGRIDRRDNEPRVAMDMPEMPSPDIVSIREWLGDTEIIGCVDVDNPLLGENGAARIFAPQKGATSEQTEQLEGWMGVWCDRIQRNSDLKICGAKGAGAAGGLGFAILALGGALVSGAEVVCDLAGLTKVLAQGDLLLTTEGKFDSTSFGGKAPWEAAVRAVDKGGQAAIFCGVADKDAVKKAAGRKVEVIEFGRDLPVEERGTKSAGLLSNAVESFLKSRSKSES